MKSITHWSIDIHCVRERELKMNERTNEKKTSKNRLVMLFYGTCLFAFPMPVRFLVDRRGSERERNRKEMTSNDVFL